MLGNHRAYATIPASDIDRAKRWYEEKLAFKPSVEEDFGSIYQTADGTFFLLYPTEHAGKAPNTLMSLTSADIDADVAALKQKGVTFLDFDEGDLKTVDSIAAIGDFRGAWFRDSEGNILSIGDPPRT